MNGSAVKTGRVRISVNDRNVCMCVCVCVSTFIDLTRKQIIPATYNLVT